MTRYPISSGSEFTSDAIPLPPSRRKLENYRETGWSAMATLEGDLDALDAAYAAQFGEETPPQDGEGACVCSTHEVCVSCGVCVYVCVHA